MLESAAIETFAASREMVETLNATVTSVKKGEYDLESS